jgi:hypothetical protein
MAITKKTFKKPGILAEAAGSYMTDLTKMRGVLKEMLKAEAFNSVKEQFKSELEVKLFESRINELWQAPGTGIGPGMAVGHGGSGNVHTNPVLGSLKSALKDAKLDNFSTVNDMADKLEKVVDAADGVIPLLDSDDLVVKREAKVLLAKLYISLSNMFKVVTEKAKELRTKLPADFDIESARNAMANANFDVSASNAVADKEASEPKPGLFRRALNRLTNTREE